MFGSGMQQSTGQTAAQASCSWKPTHSVQSSGSMTKMSSPWLIASFGHSGSHAPQLMHSTVIVVDMVLAIVAVQASDARTETWSGRCASIAGESRISARERLSTAGDALSRRVVRRRRARRGRHERRLELRQRGRRWGGRDGVAADGLPFEDWNAQESGDHARIELRSREALDLGAYFRVLSRRAERAPRRHRLVRFADVQDARAERQLFAGESQRVTAAVVALVMREHQAPRLVERRDVGQHAVAQLGVPLELLPFLGREACALEEDRVWNGDLPQVVDQRALLKHGQVP